MPRSPFDTEGMSELRQKLIAAERELQDYKVRRAIERMERENTPIPASLAARMPGGILDGQ